MWVNARAEGVTEEDFWRCDPIELRALVDRMRRRSLILAGHDPGPDREVRHVDGETLRDLVGGWLKKRAQA